MLIRLSRQQTNKDQLPRLARTMFKLFGLLLAAAGVISIASEFKTDKQMVHVTAKIYSVYEREQGGYRKYVPAVEFWINDGHVIHFQGPESSTKPEIGTSVPVVYNVLKPELAQVDGVARRWMFASVAISMGFAILVAAVFWRKAGNSIVR